jgi:hypothetical protein
MLRIMQVNWLQLPQVLSADAQILSMERGGPLGGFMVYVLQDPEMPAQSPRRSFFVGKLTDEIPNEWRYVLRASCDGTFLFETL